MNEKALLRQQIRAEKRLHPSSELQQWSRQAANRLEQHPKFISADTILLYASLPDEVDTRDLIDRWHKQKRILLPKVCGDELTLHIYTGPDCLQTGAFGINEPTGKTFNDYDKISLAVAPGMAFDHIGRRLGRGKGYYDKLFARINRKELYKIGLAFPFQLIEHVPTDTHDVRMDLVITADK